MQHQRVGRLGDGQTLDCQHLAFAAVAEPLVARSKFFGLEESIDGAVDGRNALADLDRDILEVVVGLGAVLALLREEKGVIEETLDTVEGT